MYTFDPYNVFLAIATNIHMPLMTAFVLQGHICEESPQPPPNNAVLLNFLLICESWRIKCITASINILCSATVFNIDNNQKCFLNSKSAYYYDFWRSCDTEDWSNDAENTEINYTLTYIHIENSYFK